MSGLFKAPGDSQIHVLLKGKSALEVANLKHGIFRQVGASDSLDWQCSGSLTCVCGFSSHCYKKYEYAHQTVRIRFWKLMKR